MVGAGAKEHDAAQQGHRCEEEEEAAAAEEAKGVRDHADAGHTAPNLIMHLQTLTLFHLHHSK